MKKTTKIIGAVLGVLLVAALFTGAAAATTEGYTHVDGAYDAYVLFTPAVGGPVAAEQNWYLLDEHGNQTTTQIFTSKADANGKIYFYNVSQEGLYYKSGKVLIISFPSVAAAATVTKDGSNPAFVYGLEGNFVPKEAGYTINLGVVAPKFNPAAGTDFAWQLVDENGAALKLYNNTTTPVVQNDGSLTITSDKLGTYKDGIYGFQPVITKPGYFAPTAPASLRLGEPIYFTLGKAADAKITLSANPVIVGETLVATATGLPGVEYKITYPVTNPAVVEIPGQLDVDTTTTPGEAVFTMPATGSFDLTVKAKLKAEEVTFSLYKTGATATFLDDVSLEILDGILTAEAIPDMYTIGADIELEGTSSTAGDLWFYIEGINVPFTKIATVKKNLGYEWDATIEYSNIIVAAPNGVGHALDAGTYTIYVSADDPAQKAGQDDKDYVTAGTYVAVPVVLKQSFISITDAPTVVAQGEKIVIEGTANAAKSVIWYLFGTNFFEAGVQKVKDDAFTIKIDGTYTKSDKMAAGQYFLVIQHPMYDGVYSIAPDEMYTNKAADNTYWTSGDSSLSENVTLNTILKSDKNGIYKSGATLAAAPGLRPATGTADAVAIFDNNARQTANAAEALCRALDSQNFDDMYAKASFIVGAPTSVINPIPAKIAQGEILKLSGTTTGHKGDIVSVEFLATAFAAVPKEAVGTAAFVTVNTKVQDDGTWAIEFDTSNLNVDDYTVSVAVGSLGPTTAKLTVVKAGEPVPTQTTVPTGQPTTAPTTAPTQTPASPGFGILAALAGLGAVAVLLLRRQ